ncbi:hypothetical protein FDP41_000851 [Naegleria fowleri]|uniref:Uncharacterized protein n=1 Tax=Naegleria fowleri TaxID=5763 RepID=A0A6A5CCZ6_NAEFO|nr:uncharacterized protein FDP41_000851 [Naegleria fowleri]KAF0984952.1 hypothetical protein FDP41_000851 [Naegleria fowleri]
MTQSSTRSIYFKGPRKFYCSTVMECLKRCDDGVRTFEHYLKFKLITFMCLLDHMNPNEQNEHKILQIESFSVLFGQGTRIV